MDERTVGARRGSKFDEITKDIDLAEEHYQLEMYENNEVNSKNQNNATPLNGNVCDVNLMKTFITALSESDRFEDQDFENLTLGSAKYVAEQDFKLQVPHPKERRARRNVHGKRKSRAGTLREIKLSSVENLDQTTEQLSPKHPLVANNRHSPVQTLNERKMLKFTKLVNSPLGAQLSAYQEETCETANVDVPVIIPTELDLPSEDRTPPDFPCKSATWETQEPTVQAIGGDGETWTSFPATLGDTISEIDSENTAYIHHGCFVNVDKEQSKSCATKTPTPSLDAANQWKMTAETFNLNSAGKLSEGRKICSRRVSSVGARGSPETNSLICYIAKQKMQESQRVSMMKSKMAAFMGTFQDDNNNPDPELPHLSGLWQTDSISTSCRKPTQKKKVTFGGELTPELFDKRLPSNTPLRRGEMPVHQQITFSDSPPSALKQRAKTKTGLEEKKDLQQLHGAKMSTLMFNFNISTSDDVTCNGSSPVKDHNDSTSSKLQTKLEDDLEISAVGTQSVEEDRCYPISINFEIESPLSECKFGPDNQKCHNKNDEYPCKVLEVKIEELTETLPLPISYSGHPRKRKNAKKCTATVRRNPTKKKSDSKKLLKIQPDVDKNIPAINMLESTEIEAESVFESDMNHLPSTEMSKIGDAYLGQKKTDYSSNGGVQTNFNGHSCPNIENLSEQRDKIEDKNVCNKAFDADVILNPTAKSTKTRNRDYESTKEEPRRSSRIKSNVKNISNNSSTATKGKCKQKFKKSLYGKREYASKKPLLSPIAEVLDIWSESTDFSNSEAMLECETPKRTSLIHLEGIDRGRRHSMSKSESLANGWTPGCTLRKSVGQKPQGRGRPRKGAVHCFEKEQKIQSDVESETQKGNTGDHRLVPRRLNQFDYNLKCDNSQLPSLRENKKDMAFEVKWTDNVAKDVRRGKSLIKIKSKPFSKLPVLIKSNQQGITDTQSPSEGQCEMETGHEEYFERINTDDYGGASSFLEFESNVLEDVNERREETDPNEIKKLIPIGASVSEKSQEMINESVTDDITVFDENIISPPETREEFRSRSSHRQSKTIDLPYVTQSEQVLMVNGCCVVNAGDENEEKDENLSGRKKRKERLSWKGIADPTVPYQIDDEVDTANCESLLFNFGDHCFLEQINTGMLETVNQPETCIKRSDGVLRNTKSKKKVRRSARLSGCMNREGLRWIEVTSPQHLEKRNENITMRRRTFGLIESECNVSNQEDIAGKIASQARMRKLRRRSLSCNRETAFELDEPLRKSIVLD